MVRADSFKKSCSVPDIIFLLLSGLSSHAALVNLRARQVVHIRHFADLGHWSSANKALRLSAHLAAIVLLVLGVFILSLGLLLTIQHAKLLLELVILHTEFAADRHKTTQAVNIVLVLLINLLIDLEGLIEEVHASVATSYHKLPLDFLGLDLTGTFKVLDRLLEHVLLSMVHAKTRNHIDLGRIVTIGLLVEVDSLELVLFLLV